MMPCAARRSRGVVLVAVLWMVAALAILSAALAFQARSELRNAYNARFAAEVAALGDAAIQLAVFELRTSQERPPGLFRREFELNGRLVQLTAVPSAGLVDLNQAPQPLLRDLFVFSADVPEDEAEILAERIVSWRAAGAEAVVGEKSDDISEAGGVRPRGAPFEYPEDLLQVAGITYEQYAKIARLVTVYGRAGAVDPVSAPQSVLRMLARGDDELAGRIASARDAEDPVLDLTSLLQEHLGGRSGGQIFRMDAVVSLEGQNLRRTRWVDLQPRRGDGAPWRTLRIEEVMGTGMGPQHGI